MPIVTLTSDFGDKDYYLGALKGAMYCINTDIRLVDITHHISPFDIVQAAFFVKNVYPSFPKGSIHLISVHNFYQPQPRFIILKYEEQYFVAPDNGLLSLVFEELPTQIYELEYEDKSTFPLQTIFGMVITHLTSEKPFHEIGTPVEQITERITYNAVRNANHLKGTVIHIDQYDNVILNITEDLFETARMGRDFELYFKRNEPLNRVCTSYSDVAIGDSLCLFNSTGHLEIAIHLGKAASLLGFKLEDTIQIDFL